MKILPILVTAFFTSVAVHGQNGFLFPVTPATPTDFETRNVGSSVNGVAILTEPPIPQKVKVAYTAVSPLREWLNTKGTTVQGSLIAFEAGDYSDSQKELTIVRDGKVRLLVEGKNNFSLIALASLAKKDRDYITALVIARKDAAAAAEE